MVITLKCLDVLLFVLNHIRAMTSRQTNKQASKKTDFTRGGACSNDTL